jgi:hypothetical protein
MAEVYRSAFTKDKLINSATVQLVAAEFVKLGEYKVEAGEMVSIGYGQQSGQQNAQGRIYVDLKDNGVAPGLDLNGTVRLSVYSPQNRPIEILGEWRTETLRTDITDRTLQVPFPEDDLWISEDKKLVLEFASDGSEVLGKTNSTYIMDITQAVV